MGAGGKERGGEGEWGREEGIKTKGNLYFFWGEKKKNSFTIRIFSLHL